MITDLQVTSSSTSSFQGLITDPALQNLSNATLTFQATVENGTSTWVGIGNVSLTAVPEPATMGILAAITPICLRRRPRTFRM